MVATILNEKAESVHRGVKQDRGMFLLVAEGVSKAMSGLFHLMCCQIRHVCFVKPVGFLTSKVLLDIPQCPLLQD